MAASKWSNQYRRGRNRTPRVGGPLSNEQKARICIIAREAFAQAGSPAAFEDWRHEQQLLAVGKGSLRDCTQRDYLELVARFENLAGHAGRAFEKQRKIQTQDIDLARFKLSEALRESGLEPAYAAAICRSEYKCELDRANVKQIWSLVYTIRRRGQTRRAASLAENCPF